ncbi:MAG TPA: carboxy-S-adenosyl-L-methionine synthase CmoA, partial [Gammaproteobacteria bacterium]|nr:carboxy-S-adenosyl-L-methionine synthase CmoA [Gammaproteobacteria bacterium]
MTIMKDSNTTDGLYQSERGQIDPFAFDEAVTEVFPDMIRRSIPGYQSIIDITGLIAAKRLQPSTTCYDLGCSLGATTTSIVNAIGDRECKIVAIDSSAPMITTASANVVDPRVSFEHADIRDVKYADASFVVANFTLQFLPPEDRFPFLRNIHDGLTRDGVFLVSEKIDD